MKKIIFILSLVLVLLSCSSEMENKAKDQMEKTIKEIAKNPESIKLSNIETVYCDDSICILHFNMIAQNGFGGYSNNKEEYILFKDYNDDDSTKAIYEEYIMNIDQDNKEGIEPAMKIAKGIYKIFKTDKKSKLNDKQMKNTAIRVVTKSLVITNGRVIKDEKSEKEDVDKW